MASGLETCHNQAEAARKTDSEDRGLFISGLLGK